MCFHTQQHKELKDLELKYNAKFIQPNLYSPMIYNGFDFPKTPIITNKNTKIIEMVNWGLHPNWSRADWNKTMTLNARQETLDIKPSFKSILDNRCIILVDGFFEWQKNGSTKTKYEIGFNNQLFALAGLYDIRNNQKTYTIITTEAKGIMREIHNTKHRMPVAFNSEIQIDNWLRMGKSEASYDFTTRNIDPIQLTLF